MDEAYVGMIALFGFNFAPRNWAFCQGQLIPISQNTALFSLLGTYYGGDGRTTFALPDLRGRAPVGVNPNGAAGVSPYTIGQPAGTETVQLFSPNLPSHTHLINATTEAGTAASPEGAYLAHTGNMDKEYKVNPAGKVNMNLNMVQSAGGSQPISVMQPYVAMNYCIALQGVFPARR